MQICRFNQGRIGLLLDGQWLDVTDTVTIPPNVEPALWLLDQGEAALRKAARGAKPVALDEAALESPIARPGKIVAAPVNYKAHIEEMLANGQAHGHTLTDIRKAGLFLKATSSLVGPAHGIVRRFPDRRTDHEIELCLVIGKTAANVSADRALDYVAGCCLGLDITLRGPEDRSFRKSIDTYTVLGPYLVTLDAMPDPDAVDLSLSINGDIRQRTNTSDLVMNVRDLVAFATTFYTLQPGDVIMTGTPAGVGPILPGDVLLAEGEGLGAMRVEVRDFKEAIS